MVQDLTSSVIMEICNIHSGNHCNWEGPSDSYGYNFK